MLQETDLIFANSFCISWSHTIGQLLCNWLRTVFFLNKCKLKDKWIIWGTQKWLENSSVISNIPYYIFSQIQSCFIKSIDPEYSTLAKKLPLNMVDPSFVFSNNPKSIIFGIVEWTGWLCCLHVTCLI